MRYILIIALLFFVLCNTSLTFAFTDGSAPSLFTQFQEVDHYLFLCELTLAILLSLPCEKSPRSDWFQRECGCDFARFFSLF